NRLFVDALGACQANAARPQRFTVELIDPRPDRLNEAQLDRARDQIVAPQAGDDEHIGLADARVEIIARAHLDGTHAGVARGKTRAQAIGDMGETDCEICTIGERTCRHDGYSTALTSSVLHVPTRRDTRAANKSYRACVITQARQLS